MRRNISNTFDIINNDWFLKRKPKLSQLDVVLRVNCDINMKLSFFHSDTSLLVTFLPVSWDAEWIHNRGKGGGVYWYNVISAEIHWCLHRTFIIHVWKNFGRFFRCQQVSRVYSRSTIYIEQSSITQSEPPPPKKGGGYIWLKLCQISMVHNSSCHGDYM